ncbi:sensor histidine kinase [Cupriavidus metallidurans]|uniref:sensor histidine kinase n=1 Tax=Cupriavidus metallidurans TaxID=119219 RepID=UPI00055E00EA|nr:PAS domain-containing sensor histidine kinase [Cupriavidus metallidurans]
MGPEALTGTDDNGDRRIAENEARLAGIIRSSMEAIISVDEEQRVVLFNPMAETLFGLPAEQAMGRPLGDFIPARFRTAHAAHVTRFGVTGVSDRQMGRQLTLYALRQDGTEFPIEASISQTSDGAGHKLFTVMLRDVTARVRAEAALQRSREELQALSDSILAAREDESRRVARELHDDLGQRLSALKMDLVMLETDLRADCGAVRALKQVSAMHTVIDETIAAVRRISSDLRPALLDELGLAAALDWLAKDFSRRYAISVSTRTPEEIDVTEQAATAVFRIVQEALNNVVHHADASEAWVTLSHQNQNQDHDHGQFVLRVHDDGRGWNGQPKDGARRSFGLLGIRERARLLGGTVSIEHTPGEGFELVVTFPGHPDCKETQA